MNLQEPFDTFRIEKHAGEYKNFGNTDDKYPLKGVTYPVDYGDIDGYITEDGANLDLFVGDNGTLCGYFRVYRPELTDGEHKFYIGLTKDDQDNILKEFEPVIIEHHQSENMETLKLVMEQFKTS